MTDFQIFAFVWLPLGVCVFGALLAAVGMKIIDGASPRSRPGE
jgi:hypothetical protein